MKILFCLFASAALLCGCNKSSDQKIARLESNISELQSNVADLYVCNENRRTAEKLTLDAVASMQTIISNHAAITERHGLQLQLAELQFQMLWMAATNQRMSTLMRGK